MAPIDLIRRLSASLRIVHHIPGRVRLKLDAAPDAGLAAAAGDVDALRRALGGSPGIRTVSVNPLARSCTIEYDPSVIPPTAWPDLLRGDLSAAAQTLLRIVTAGLGQVRV
ncbi:heavy-metal-associated domain-containing protein [Azospirillum sp. RWY-5-1]|uniref:Heavy-metal-associated domain-containing protein n=1 Tax=Azospirillum oleiclasticum TaxID=2735135 RepID=A0ABX2TCS3_9PROT|nr:heavy-metal-associated domain-containing protein [Azospirillum oleiclasticum]NYZ13656.1 heavy-metal-associated domain-containing protein [Azospirillum oleiclasticum]NYZ20928.1 heavy-metal-associated domain-containing protein [Azospirillum oleiclasticum]